MRKYKDKFYLDFEHRCKEDHGLTPFIHFGRAILGKKWGEEIIKHQFNKCLKLKDYPDFTLDEAVYHFIGLSYLKIS